DDLVDPRTEYLVVRPADRPFTDPIYEREASGGVPDERDAGEVLHERAENPLAALHLRFGAAQRGALARLLHGALDGGRKAGEVRLQHVIGRPAAQRSDRGLLADRPGHED